MAKKRKAAPDLYAGVEELQRRLVNAGCCRVHLRRATGVDSLHLEVEDAGIAWLLPDGRTVDEAEALAWLAKRGKGDVA